MQRTIATIFFEPVLIERAIYGGTFLLPAVPKPAAGQKPQPAYLVIRDHTQWEPLPVIAGGRSIPRTITGEEIAPDVMEHAAHKGRGMTIECGPGVWIVRDTLPEFDDDGKPIMDIIPLGDGKAIQRQRSREAEPIEKARMAAEDLDEGIRRQDRYCEYLVGQGDGHAAKAEESILITRRMKLAAKYSGREREWLKDYKTGDTKVCQFCTKSVSPAAITCEHCHQIIDYQRYAFEEAKRNDAVKRASKAA